MAELLFCVVITAMMHVFLILEKVQLLHKEYVSLGKYCSMIEMHPYHRKMWLERIVVCLFRSGDVLVKRKTRLSPGVSVKKAGIPCRKLEPKIKHNS
ncbi:MAG: hypothetical protein HN922_00305 [Anaerolineae bacterium]|jgi:hypothetical protein|nr:hypothetical protein [Anaerolineae bacterium]